MQNIKIELINHFGIESVLSAIEEPYENIGVTEELLNNIIKAGHTSVLEHAYFQFKIEGISRACLIELERHRISSMTVKSTRYTLHKMLKEFESISGSCLNEEVINLIDKYYVNYFKQYGTQNEEMRQVELLHYVDLFENLKSMYCAYEIFKKLKQNKIITENVQDYLKGFLHESKRTSLQWTINLRSLRNFLELRQSPKAHFEIRHLSELIKKCLEEETAYKKYLM